MRMRFWIGSLKSLNESLNDDYRIKDFVLSLNYEQTPENCTMKFRQFPGDDNRRNDTILPN